MLIRLNLSKKIFLEGLAIIICFAAIIGWFFLQVKAKLHEEMVTTIKIPVELAFSLMTEYDERVKKGEFKLEEAQKRADEWVKTAGDGSPELHHTRGR